MCPCESAECGPVQLFETDKRGREDEKRRRTGEARGADIEAHRKAGGRGRGARGEDTQKPGVLSGNTTEIDKAAALTRRSPALTLSAGRGTVRRMPR